VVQIVEIPIGDFTTKEELEKLGNKFTMVSKDHNIVIEN
jgi:hypothetical protein